MTTPLIHQPSGGWQKSPWPRLVTLIIVVGFLLLRPKLEGWLNGNSSSDVPSVTDAQVADSRQTVDADSKQLDASEPPPGSNADEVSSDEASSPTAEDKNASKKKTPPSDPGKPVSSKGDSKGGGSETPSLGQLSEIQPDVFESTAGLIYGKGSEDGHRLKHIMKHAEDSPTKKVHGVFDGERDQILAMIDDAWTRHQKNDSTVRSSLQNNRIVITAKMKERIGYVGGEEGERKGHPECRYLRIVIDKPNRIVTAYPVQSW